MTARSPLTRLLNLVVAVNLTLVSIAQAVPAAAADRPNPAAGGLPANGAAALPAGPAGTIASLGNRARPGPAQQDAGRAALAAPTRGQHAPALQFVENVGQVDRKARFQVLGLGPAVQLAEDGVWVTVLEKSPGRKPGEHERVGVAQPPPSAIGRAQPARLPRRGVRLHLGFDGANPHPRLEPIQRQTTHVSFLAGNDPARSYPDVPVWAGVRYVDLYPGIDLEITGSASQWNWRIIARPGADKQLVHLRVEGASTTTLSAGRFAIKTAVGDFSLPLPEGLASDGGRLQGHPAPSAAALAGEPAAGRNLVSRLEASSSDFAPLIFSTFLGGNDFDEATGIAVDASGAVFVTGEADGSFPTTPGVFVSPGTLTNAFVTKLSPDGSQLEYSTYISDASNCLRGVGIAVGADGSASVIGNPCDSHYDSVFFRLNATGTELLSWGQLSSAVVAISLDAAGVASVAGNAPDGVFVAKVVGNSNPATVARSIVLPDISVFWLKDMAGDAQGNLTLTGDATSPEPATLCRGSAYCATRPGANAFVAKFDASLNAVYVAIVGGADGTTGAEAVGVGADGAVNVVGHTYSTQFPALVGAPNPNPIYQHDALLFRLGAMGELACSTLLGGTGADFGTAVAVGAGGEAYVGGQTGSSDFPGTASGFQPSYAGNYDAFIAKVDSACHLVSATYLGGSIDEEWIDDLAMGPDNSLYVAGSTASPDFPVTANAALPSYGGGYDGFVVRLGTQTAGTLAPLPEAFVRSSCQPAGSRPGDPRSDRLLGLCGNTVKTVGDPINTRTGAMDYTTVDLSFPALGGQMVFQRFYSSLVTNTFTSTLGFGWTHNQDTRLILPDSPGGVSGQVRFKPHNANELIFSGPPAGPFSPYPGVLARLERTISPAGYRVTAPDQATYTFDGSGRLLTWADALGHNWAYTYNPAGRLSQVGEASSQRYLNLTYDAAGRLDGVSDPLGRTVHYDYDPRGDLAVVTDAQGHPWTYRYDAGHRLTEIVDPLGHTVARTEYDAQGRAVRQFDAQATQTLAISYNPDGSRQVTDAQGQTTSHWYDGRGTLTGLVDAAGVTAKSYDANFRPASTTDARGQTTHFSWSQDGVNLTSLSDAAGHETKRVYDALNNLTRSTDVLGHTNVFTYTGTLLTASTDALGNTTTYAYTPGGLLQAQTDPLGRATRYTYNAAGQRASVTDPAGLVTTYGYDRAGRLITTTLPGGVRELRAYDNLDHLLSVTKNYTTTTSTPNYLDEYNLTTTYGFDGAGRQVSVSDPLGHITRNEYDDAGRLVKVTENELAGQPQNYLDQHNRVTAYGYDRLGNRVRITDTMGMVTRTEYDALNRPITITTNFRPGQPATADVNLREVKSYDAIGNVVRDTDAGGHVTVTGYDSLNRPVTVTLNFQDGIYDAEHPDLDLITVTTYDAAGQVVARSDPAGRRTAYTYDALGRLIRTTDALAGVATTEYAADGQPVRETDAAGHATRREYDPAGRPVRVVDALGGATVSEYDAFGRRAATVDALGGRTSYGYSATGRLLATTDALGGVTAYAYDALGRTVAVSDPLGRTTHTAYDALGRAVLVTDALSGTVASTYDILGRKTRVRDANGHETTYGYDALGRLTLTTDATGRGTGSTYDAAGNRRTTSECGPLAGCRLQASLSYDAQGQLIARSDALGHASRSGYDAVGNRVMLTDANGIVTRYEYDALNRLTTVIENSVAGRPADHETNVTTRYGYDRIGNRTAITNALNAVSTTAYDALARLTLSVDPLGHTTRYGYDALGNRKVITDANGAVTTFSYDPRQRPLLVSYPGDHQTVQYRYDRAGNRTAMTDTLGVTTYTYDALNRPLSVRSPLTGTVSYRYDGAGNRTRLTYPTGQVVTYTYDLANRLTGLVDWAGRATGYGYDDLGQLITTTLPNGVVSHNSYDAAGRLVEIAQQRGETVLGRFSYGLDPAGNRVAVTETLLSPALALGPLGTPAGLALGTEAGAGGRLAAGPTPNGGHGLNALRAQALAGPAAAPGGPAGYTNGSFLVAWTAGADPGGSGLALCAIQQRTDGGPWVTWQDCTAAGAAPFTPTGPAHRYDFQSLAQDRAGTAVTSTLQTVVYDAVLPAVAITGPVAETAYAAAPEFAGGAGDGGGAGLAAVRLALQRADGRTWDGAGWLAGTAWLTATGTSAWTCAACRAALGPAGSYTLTAQAVDRAGNAATALARFTWSPPPIATTTPIAYTYDALNRLVDARYADGRRFQYAYDAAGNRTQATQTITTTAVTTHYSYDPANRLTAVEGQPYTWDNAGNLLDDGVKRYRYDQADRLVAITSTAGLAWSAKYDGDGVRLGQVVNGQAITYTLDLAAPLVTVLAEAHPNKRITYLYGLGDSPLAGDDGAAWTYLSGRDALNSVRQETDAAGQVLTARSFDPYGVVLSGDGGAPIGFTGEYSDAASGLLFLRARYLQPTEGRFITRDVWPGDDRWPITFNAWAYGGAHPLRYMDPSGHMPCNGQFGCQGEDGHPGATGGLWWLHSLPRTVPDFIQPGGYYDQGVIGWGDHNVDIYVPSALPRPPAASTAFPSFRAAPGYSLTGEEYPSFCPASYNSPRTRPPVMGRWRELVRVEVPQFSGEMAIAGALAGLGGPESLPVLPVQPDPTESKPRLRYNQGEVGTAAGITAMYALNSGLEAGRQLNLFVLQVSADNRYRVVIIYDSPMTRSRFFASYWGYAAFDPQWATLYK